MLGFIQKQALILMQALLGVISANFRMIYLHQDSGNIIVTIILESEDEDDFEEIEDLKSEFEALQESPIDYDFVVKVTDADISWPDDNSIVVFKRREF
ncbi:hypothetical protein [Pseudoalteromonas luteoviolacea]|uniref:hypothetical protein n=1 Tax=Pseudoalteromonas luteoviolacea TaxID=43657 RepID=UPI0011517807|nr:hypothetical protein [Pseudoalteromonas luteoviolacea]TQF67863.1 hypothetical protein FLM44_22035 [Pseudoalteromonas luteoviolacea]